MGTDAYSGTGCMEFCALGNLSHEENFPDISTLTMKSHKAGIPVASCPGPAVSLKAGCDSSVSF